MPDIKWFLVLANFLLVGITFFYLLETRELRKLGERSFLFENKPKVYIEPIKISWSLVEKRDALQSANIIRVKNVGKTEALKLRVSYRFTTEGVSEDARTINIEKLYSDQSIRFDHKFGVNIEHSVYEILKKAKEAKQEISFKEGFISRINLEISLNFLDFDENEYEEEFKFIYDAVLNEWVIPRD